MEEDDKKSDTVLHCGRILLPQPILCPELSRFFDAFDALNPWYSSDPEVSALWKTTTQFDADSLKCFVQHVVANKQVPVFSMMVNSYPKILAKMTIVHRKRRKHKKN